MSKTRTRARRSRTSAVELIIHPEQSAPVRVAGWLWRSRAELTALATYLAAYLLLDAYLPPWGVWATLAAAPPAPRHRHEHAHDHHG